MFLRVLFSNHYNKPGWLTISHIVWDRESSSFVSNIGIDVFCYTVQRADIVRLKHSTRFVGKPEGEGSVMYIWLILTTFSRGVNTKWGSRGTRGGLNPPTPQQIEHCWSIIGFLFREMYTLLKSSKGRNFVLTPFRIMSRKKWFRREERSWSPSETGLPSTAPQRRDRPSLLGLLL